MVDNDELEEFTVEEKYLYNQKNKDELNEKTNNDYKKYDIFDSMEMTRTKKKLETLKQIRKLEQIKEAIKDRDPKEVEKAYFEKFDCFTEKAKIELEAKYLKSKLVNDKEKYINNPNYAIDTRIVNHILDIADKMTPNEVSLVKQCVVLIELELGLDIIFVTEVDNVYKLKTKGYENQEGYIKGK